MMETDGELNLPADDEEFWSQPLPTRDLDMAGSKATDNEWRIANLERRPSGTSGGVSLDDLDVVVYYPLTEPPLTGPGMTPGPIYDHGPNGYDAEWVGQVTTGSPGPLAGPGATPPPPVAEPDADYAGYIQVNPSGDDPAYAGGGAPDIANAKADPTSVFSELNTDAFTICAWAFVMQSLDGGDQPLNQVIVSQWQGSPTDQGWALQALPTGTGWSPRFMRTGIACRSMSRLEFGKWYFIVATYERGVERTTAIVYINGHQNLSAAGSDLPIGSVGPFRMGCGDMNAALSGGWRYLIGRIGYVILVNGAMSSDRVKKLYDDMLTTGVSIDNGGTTASDPIAQDPSLVLTPGTEGWVLVTIGGEPVWGQIDNDAVEVGANIDPAKIHLANYIRNSHVASDAAVAVSKLASGSDGDVLTTVAGVPVWAALSGAGGSSKASENDGTVFSRDHFNFLDTSEVTVTLADDSAGDEIDVSLGLGTVPLSKLSLTGASEGEVLKITSGAPSWEAEGGGGGAGTGSDLQSFTGNGTWSKPAGARWVEIVCVGPGGGGGGGRGSTNASLKSGGGGGGGGALTRKVFRASDLPATLTITVGAGGAAGAAGVSASGGTGGDGGNTTCVDSGVTYAAAGGGAGAGGGGSGTANGGGGGGAAAAAVGSTLDGAGGKPRTGAQAVVREVGTQGNCAIGGAAADGCTASPPQAGGNSEYGGAGGGSSDASASVAGKGGSSVFGGAGGGGGGGTTATPAASTPGVGGATGAYASGGGGAAGASGASPTAGTGGAATASGGPCGQGGGGGGAGTGTAAGANGGDGGVGCGGGGGGAGVTTGGAGGKGGRGEVRILSW